MMKMRLPNYRARRFVAALITGILTISFAIIELQSDQQDAPSFAVESTQDRRTDQVADVETTALEALTTLTVKGRAPATGYARTQFGNGWSRGKNGCDTRNNILQRDLYHVEIDENCRVHKGVLIDPYTGKEIQFVRGPSTSAAVQIDHVVALHNAWQTGAQLLMPEVRTDLANDPLNLLAVDGPSNQQKGSSDAATWLPANRAFRCAYVARQISVKQRYALWVTSAEKTAMQRVLSRCPQQPLTKE